MRRKSVAVFLLAIFLVPFSANSAMDEKQKQRAYKELREYFRAGPVHQFVLVPEGEFVCVFNPTVKEWVQKKWDLEMVRRIRSQLSSATQIELTDRGFVKAANRDLGDGNEKDNTNYDAVWVRDSAWVFWGLQETGKHADAKKLIMALWDYYATPAQFQRFQALIKDPSLVRDKMAVPHIRFDGASPTLDDVYVQGKPEVWNHRQMDAHGLFVMSVVQALNSGVINKNDLNDDRLKVLSLFPKFFEAVKFWTLEDAGAWEEIDRRNTSSIALVTRSMMMLQELYRKNPRWDKSSNKTTIPRLIKEGLKVVHQQIKYGGESPLYDISKNPSLFRRADAALFNVILPSPLPGLSEQELRSVMTILESLKRPAGILRYENDSYQSGNFWIQEPGSTTKEGTVGTTGDTSDAEAFKVRLAALVPHTEAQWFFDSQLAMARMELYSLALKRQDKMQAEHDLSFAQLHLKRALGQITGQISGRALRTADGLPIKDWLAPESINSVIIDGKTFYLPSPITPLNWAKASLEMAMWRFEKILSIKPKN